MHPEILTASPGNQVENVGRESTEHSEVSEIVSSLNHRHNINQDDKVEEAKKGFVVFPVACCEVMRQLVAESLEPGL